MALLPLGLADSGSQEEGASITWTGGHTTGEGERERNITGHLSITDREEEVTKGGTTASTYCGD